MNYMAFMEWNDLFPKMYQKTFYSRGVGRVDFDHESGADADSDHLLKLVGGVIW